MGYLAEGTNLLGLPPQVVDPYESPAAVDATDAAPVWLAGPCSHTWASQNAAV